MVRNCPFLELHFTVFASLVMLVAGRSGTVFDSLVTLVAGRSGTVFASCNASGGKKWEGVAENVHHQRQPKLPNFNIFCN